MADHVELAALLVRDVLEAAFAIDVSGADVRGVDRQPDSLEAQFPGQSDAASHQFGADAEVLIVGADDDQHLALLLVDGKQSGVADEAPAAVDCDDVDAGGEHFPHPLHANFVLDGRQSLKRAPRPKGEVHFDKLLPPLGWQAP